MSPEQEELVLSNLEWATYGAWRVWNRTGRKHDLEELNAVAYLGVVIAATQWRNSGPFRALAAAHVKSQLWDYVRQVGRSRGGYQKFEGPHGSQKRVWVDVAVRVGEDSRFFSRVEKGDDNSRLAQLRLDREVSDAIERMKPVSDEDFDEQMSHLLTVASDEDRWLIKRRLDDLGVSPTKAQAMWPKLVVRLRSKIRKAAA
jgi:DNA-directed RNA polymerase specialized sigma24 family protein